MFVRRRRNPSGSISITVVDKSRGKYDVVRSFGTVKSEAEADLLENKAREWVREQEGDPETLFDRMDEAQLRAYAATLPGGRLELAGPELFYGEVFDRLELGRGMDPLFRHIVLCRLFDPGSKARTVGYLKRYLGQPVSPEEIYRVNDHLHLAEMLVSKKIPVHAQWLSFRSQKAAMLLLSAADGSPVAARLLDRRSSAAVQRLARRYGASEPVVFVKGALPAFRMSLKDARWRPFYRRARGRLEGHLCVCLAALAVQHEWDRLLSEAVISMSPEELRQAARSLYRLNYVSSNTGRPKSVLIQMTPQQKTLFDLLHQ